MFLDEAVVDFRSGTGGAGSASFHREKHVPRGGPNGSDGGRGGNIVLVADHSKRTLYDFKFQHSFVAPNGSDAIGNKSGRDGADIEVRLPVGTIVYDDETGEPLVDLSADGMRYVLCKGGRGGFGNLHYTSSVRQAPTIAQNGAPAEAFRARLELKLLADVGIIGLPNAGKSTLISRLSAAKPKIADYPFTTITPNLGVVSYGHDTFTVADMPGLIEGASEGRGLGHQFLRHVERCSVLVHLIEIMPLDESDPVENFKLIEAELKAYSEELWSRPRIVAITKVDIVGGADAPEVPELRGRLQEAAASILNLQPDEDGDPVLPKVFVISGVTGEGTADLTKEMHATVLAESHKPHIPIVTPVMRKEGEDAGWDVEVEGNAYRVVGKRITRMVAMTRMNEDESLRYLHRRLVRIGVIEKLSQAGAKDGDTVRIGELEFDFSDDF